MKVTWSLTIFLLLGNGQSDAVSPVSSWTALSFWLEVWIASQRRPCKRWHPGPEIPSSLHVPDLSWSLDLCAGRQVHFECTFPLGPDVTATVTHLISRPSVPLFGAPEATALWSKGTSDVWKEGPSSVKRKWVSVKEEIGRESPHTMPTQQGTPPRSVSGKRTHKRWGSEHRLPLNHVCSFTCSSLCRPNV